MDDMINEKNAKQYCSEPLELIENYAEAIADTTKMWCCHHRLGVRDGVTVTDELKANNMYENRPACELIFVTKSQHAKLHPDVYSKHGKEMNAKLTPEQRLKAGKNRAAKMTFEQRSKGGKNGGKKMNGKLWWNNGTINKRSAECPGEGWVRGCLKHSR